MATTKFHAFDHIVIDRIVEYCKMHNISMRKLAKASGMTDNQMYFLTSDRRRLDLEQYVKICIALKEPFDYFIRNIPIRNEEV